MSIKITQKTGTCIFCGKGGLTKEHVWPDWLQKHLPSRPGNTAHKTGMVFTSKYGMAISPIEQGKQSRPGPPTSRKLRIVCNTCNNEWMSILQNKAKGLLLELFEQRWSIVSEDDRKIVINWITMFTMVSEFLNQERIGISRADRETFYRTVSPLPNWKIWLSWHNGRSVDGTKVAHGAIFHGSLMRTPMSQLHQPHPWDSQVTTAVCGNLLFQVFSSSAIDMHVDENYWSSLNKLSILVPNSGDVNPSARVFRDADLMPLHQSLLQYAQRSRR